MTSSSGPSGASVHGGLDVAWKYARPIEGNKHGTICTFCESTFKSGGITRLKYHLAGFDPHKSVKKCKEVPPDIKKEVIAWMKEKESSKQHKKFVEENIRSTTREGYMGNKSSNPVDDEDDDDDDGYAYPPDMHPAEKEDYLATIRASKQERFRQGGVYEIGSKRFAGGASGSSQPQYCCTQSLRDPLPSPLVSMPHKNTRAKQRTIKGMIRNSAEVLGRYCSKFFILENVAPQKASSPYFKNMIVAAQQAGQGVATPSPYEIKHKYLDMEHTDMQAYVEKVKEDWGVYGCTIMSDGWTGPTRLSIINFMDVIKEVEPSNVVHIVTDNGLAFVKAGQMMMERYPIYWTPCAAHCIDLIFEDIEKQESVANVINKARKLTNYIYNHSWLLAQMRIFLQSIYEPLYSILRIVDTEVVPTMPILYDMFHIMKEKISKLKGKKWLLKIINHRWDVTLSRPLHQAAHYLNPRYQYETGVGHNKELLSGLQRVFERLNLTGDRGLQAFGAESHMLGPMQGQRRPLRDDASASRMESSSNSSDNDTGSNAGSGGNEEGRQYSPFTVEADFTHATQDEDHGCREAGPGIRAIGKQYSKKRSQPINPSEEDMAINFGSMSIGTRPSTNSNESYDGYGYVMSNYSGTRYGAQDEETDYGPTSWVNPNYPIYGRTVGSSRETYVHHVQTWLTNYSGYMTWYDYCINLDGCSSLFEPHRSSSFM
ncbi:unnamed protein product [Prunus armeniaca]